MTSEQILARATVLVGCTAVSLVLGVVLYRRQCDVQVFLEYTKRYSETMNMFPREL